jgi:ketosteroid isomerase-like protein
VSTDTRTLAERFFVTLEARDWDGLAALLHPDVTYQIPQSGERILGRDRYIQFNSEYPGEWHLTPKVIVADQAGAGVWFDWTLGDGEHADGVVFLQVEDGAITQVTDFWPEPYDPPPGRDHLVERS